MIGNNSRNLVVSSFGEKNNIFLFFSSRGLIFSLFPAHKNLFKGSEYYSEELPLFPTPSSSLQRGTYVPELTHPLPVEYTGISSRVKHEYDNNTLSLYQI